MKDKRQHDDSKTPFLGWFWNWFRELPPLLRAVLVGLVLLALLFALLPRSLFHSFNCQVQNVPQDYQSSNGYFIDNQVIVIGRREDIEKVIGTPSPVTPVPTSATLTTPGTPPTTITLFAVATPTVAGTPATPQPSVPTTAVPTTESGRVTLNPIEGCDLSYLNYRKDRDSGAAVETGKLVMLLYEIPNTEKSVGDTIADINVAASAIAKKNGVPTYDISVDPNYLTRLSDSTGDPCGLPSDPGGGGGRTNGMPGILSHGPYNARQAEMDFTNQWAFGSQGINLPNSSTFAYTGSGVRVGVFDTSPYRISFPFTKKITMAFPTTLSFKNWDAGGATMMSNHGLFVASLIHRIAPKSSIQLVRVLNEDGCGQLWYLNKGLEEYKSRMSRWPGKLDKTVINMSLGIRVPQANGQSNPELAKLAKKEIGTLKKLIKPADQMGAIVVAAAGNDSTVIRDKANGNIKRTVVDMQIPAGFDNVIGVVATNPNGQQSCYSNKAHGKDDVAAPGGEGGTDPRDLDNLCVSRAASWDVITPPPDICHDADIENCKYGLISLVQTRYGPQYMLWSGSSFAAPLVSGMAALAYQKLQKEQAVCVIHGKPLSAIMSYTDLGTGMINIGNNFAPNIIQQCLHP